MEVIESKTTYSKPKNYLKSFQAFLQNYQNQITALSVVVQCPYNLTRQQLRELRLIDTVGHSNLKLHCSKPPWKCGSIVFSR